MHPHHPHLSEAWLVHAFAWLAVAAAVVLALLVLVKLFAPEIGALLIGLGS